MLSLMLAGLTISTHKAIETLRPLKLVPNIYSQSHKKVK